MTAGGRMPRRTKIVEKVDSVFLDATDYSPLK